MIICLVIKGWCYKWTAPKLWLAKITPVSINVSSFESNLILAILFTSLATTLSWHYLLWRTVSLQVLYFLLSGLVLIMTSMVPVSDRNANTVFPSILVTLHCIAIQQYNIQEWKLLFWSTVAQPQLKFNSAWGVAKVASKTANSF